MPTLSRRVKAALLFAVIAVVAALVATFGRTPSLSQVNVAFVSGSAEGNYHAIVTKAAAEARRQRGRIENLTSAGSVENIERLAAAKASCDIQFALVQDGLPWPESHPFQLIGRLPISESFVVLGRDADRIRSVTDLRGHARGHRAVGKRQRARGAAGDGATRGVGHQGDHATVAASSSRCSNAAISTLAPWSLLPSPELMLQAVRDRKLQIVDISAAEALARRLPSARGGIIKAGYYDPVRELPPTDKRIIEIDTLVIGNGCARESVTQGVITALHARVSQLRDRESRARESDGIGVRVGGAQLLRQPGSRRGGRVCAVVHRHHAHGALGATCSSRFRVLFGGAGGMAPLPTLATGRGRVRYRRRRLTAIRARHHGRGDRGDGAGAPSIGRRKRARRSMPR